MTDMAEFPPEPPAGLLDRVAAGDERAFGELYGVYAGPVYTVAMRMLARADAAEEVLQEVCIKLLETVGCYRGDGPFWGWLRRLTVNQVLMRMRAEKARPELVAVDDPVGGDWHGATSGPDPARALDGRALAAALAELPTTSRVVVWLYDVEGWTHQEIAAAMGRSVSFSKSQLVRAHAKLRELLAEEVRDASGHGTTARTA